MQRPHYNTLVTYPWCFGAPRSDITSVTAMFHSTTLRNGEIDYKQIPQAILYVIGQETPKVDIPPILVVANLGTTMKGACDDITNILSSLYSIGITRDRIFVHLDAAFHGGFWYLDKNNPNYQMGINFNSIAINGYK